MIIYKATNIVNQKIYIGQTTKALYCRSQQHISESNRNISNSYFHKSIKKYGSNSFTWEVLCECDSKDELDEMEFHYIKQYHSYISEWGYNMTFGGASGMYGLIHTPETKQKMSKSKKGKFTGMDNGMFGKHHSEESLQRMSIAHSGENNAFYGKRHSTDTRQTMSINSKGKNSGETNTNYGKIGDKNHNAKTYLITYPSGDTKIITGITQFCKDNGLIPQCMCLVAKGKQKHHKGYKCTIMVYYPLIVPPFF